MVSYDMKIIRAMSDDKLQDSITLMKQFQEDQRGRTTLRVLTDELKRRQEEGGA